METESRAAGWRGVWWRLVIALPALLLVAGELAFLGAALVAGPEVRWPVYDLNLAEAAAARDGAEVARQLEAGADPNRRLPVRAGLLRSEAVDATALEAALAIRRFEIVPLLERHDATLDAATWRRLSCWARGNDDQPMVVTVDRHRPSEDEPVCAGDERAF